MRPYPLPAGVKGKAFIIESRFAPFPDSLRNAQPRVYNGQTYSAAEHYSDSSVLVFIPDYFDAQKSYRFVCWFHGWNNNIDSSLKTFQLLEQFYAARRNAIFIFPEGPKNAPDSYGGKLESPEGYLKLWSDIVNKLFLMKIVHKNGYHPINASHVFSGHSGAYKMIAKSIEFEPILYQNSTVLLFDGLYGEVNTYLQYVEHYNLYFLHLYTDDGGTKDNSLQFMKTLADKGIRFLHKEEEEVREEDLRNNRIIFLHSKKGHNEVITHHNNFERFLRAFEQY
ncbi:hypothetical protein [Phnomibacter sp. MR]|uniref:hypothetical protein n=1 Tax=Phnomibacter sp. MR TaxID=3042318 RepID=UPI003A803DCF